MRLGVLAWTSGGWSPFDAFGGGDGSIQFRESYDTIRGWAFTGKSHCFKEGRDELESGSLRRGVNLCNGGEYEVRRD